MGGYPMGKAHGSKPPKPPAFKGRGAPPPGSHSSSGKGACEMWVPVAVALLPYALVRLGWDTWRSRRG